MTVPILTIPGIPEVQTEYMYLNNIGTGTPAGTRVLLRSKLMCAVSVFEIFTIKTEVSQKVWHNNDFKNLVFF